jgi:hypothetical protein
VVARSIVLHVVGGYQVIIIINITIIIAIIIIIIIIAVTFPDAKSVDRSYESFYLYPNGAVSYISKLTLQITLRDISLEEYPFDKHDILITYFPNNKNVQFMVQEMEAKVLQSLSSSLLSSLSLFNKLLFLAW